MTKEEFLKYIEDIIDDKIFIGSSADDLEQEIRNNMWCISISQDTSQQLSIKDLNNFLNKVIENRKQQIRQQETIWGMRFYLWFDSQAGQLRFNLISLCHNELPFKSKLRFVESLNEIIEDFLNYKYHDGIPAVFAENSDNVDNEYYEDALKVYEVILTKI